MKSASNLIIFAFAFLALDVVAYAQSPREQLQQLAIQLQQTPNDNALRERIIKLGTEIKPPLAVPEEARRSFVEGGNIVKYAKNVESQKLAIGSFTEAVKIAPWWGDAYYNLAVAQELTGQLNDAERTLEWFLLTNPGESEAREAQDRIYGLSAKRKLAAAEQKQIEENSPQAKAKRQEELIRSLNGVRFVGETNYGDSVVANIYEIHGRAVHKWDEVVSNPSGRSFRTSTTRPSMRNSGDNNRPPFVWALNGREFAHEEYGEWLEISEDGSRIQTLMRNKNGEIVSALPLNTIEPRRIR